VTFGKAPIIWAVNEALHAIPALLQHKPRALEMNVVEPAPCIEEVNRCEVAFASFDSRDPT
jgi:hypothetical protein